MITEYRVMKKEPKFKKNDWIVGSYHQFCDEMHYYSIIEVEFLHPLRSDIQLRKPLVVPVLLDMTTNIYSF